MTRYEDGVGDIRDHYGVITCLSFSSDGTMLASCGEDARSGLHFLAVSYFGDPLFWDPRVLKLHRQFMRTMMVGLKKFKDEPFHFYAPLNVLLFHLNISSVSILVSIFEHCRLMVWKVGKTSVDRELLFEKDLHKYVMSKKGKNHQGIIFTEYGSQDTEACHL